MKKPLFSLMLALALTASFSLQGESPGGTPPPTEKKTVDTRYGNSKVEEDYRWLEDSEDSKVKTWTEAQNQYARNWLDRLPSLSRITKVLEKWTAATSPSYYGLSYKKGALFALKFQPPKNQPLLITLSPNADPRSEHVVLDPNQWNAKGTTAIDFFEPSPDGKRVAVSLSDNGSEVGNLHLFDVATGKEMGEQIDHINNPTAGGSVAWTADGTGLFYTRYPAPGSRPKEDLGFFQQIYFHRLGTPPAKDEYVLGKDFPRIAEIKLETSRDGKYCLAEVANGDGGEFAHYLRQPSGEWVPLTKFEDAVTHAHFGTHDDLYLLSKQGSPRGRILRLSVKQPDLKKAQVAVSESAGAITAFEATDNRLYVSRIEGGPSTLESFDYRGGKPTVVPVAGNSAVSELVGLDKDELLYQSQSYVEPVAWYRYQPTARGKAGSKKHPTNATPVKTKLASTSPVSFKDIDVTREFATSKDGTRVPLSLIYRKGMKRDGKNPTLLYGYGGYGINLTPRFRTSLYLWLEQGGVYVVANLRGGAEYGEDWHRAGRLTQKQNVFDDFIGVAEHLIATHVTSPDHLAIEGGSNGGLLMGAALTQRPELFRAVVSHVGIYDMLRVELDPNGAFNVTEFGTVKDPAQFKALYAYSPYHHVVAGRQYPAVLFMTGAYDGRVNPFQSKKMTARLQAVNKSERPVLLRVSFSSGHGIGSSLTEQIHQQADAYAFLFDQLGMKY